VLLEFVAKTDVPTAQRREGTHHLIPAHVARHRHQWIRKGLNVWSLPLLLADTPKAPCTDVLMFWLRFFFTWFQQFGFLFRCFHPTYFSQKLEMVSANHWVLVS
jgi:hypothetical protein